MAPKKKWSRRQKRLLGVLIVAGIVLAASYSVYRHFKAPGETVASLATIQAEKRIIDVHEHIQSIKEAPKMLAAMDALGIQKTVLLGSSLYTLTLNLKAGFTRYDENNEELLRICKEYPGRFEAWPTINPLDSDKLEKFQRLVERGATGLKLYLGHGAKPDRKNFMFHVCPIDDPGMMPVYQYCEDHFIPICLHVNPDHKKGPGFAEEFINVLERFPNLKIVCPHYMLSSGSPRRLQEFLDRFPNLYTDISFGYDDYFKEGMTRITKNPSRFRTLFTKYPTRFFFSTDLVITDEAIKTQQWITQQLKAYLDMLTLKTYKTPMFGDQPLNGLQLPPKLLERILYKNFQDFEALRPKNTHVGKVNWSKIGVTPPK